MEVLVRKIVSDNTKKNFNHIIIIKWACHLKKNREYIYYYDYRE